jgi:hypothetical protein
MKLWLSETHALEASKGEEVYCTSWEIVRNPLFSYFESNPDTLTVQSTV